MEQNDFRSWRSHGKTIDNFVNMQNFEKKYDLILPEYYKNFIRVRDGGVLKKDLFFYQFRNANWSNCVGRFLYWDKEISADEYIIDQINDPPEFFPNDLIPFAPDGGGNYICFDYRNCREDPPIVYWDHGIEENEGIFHLADSFEEFLSMLKSEEEIAALTT